MRTFNNFYFSLRVIQYISIDFDQYKSGTLPMRKCHFNNAIVSYKSPIADGIDADRGRNRCGPRTESVRTADGIGADRGRER